MTQPTIEDGESPPNESSEELQTRRIKRVFWACELGLLIGCLLNVYLHQMEAAWIAGVSALALFAVLWQIQQGRSALAGSLIILVLTAAVTLLIWTGRGLSDEAMIAYPGILVYAVLAGSRRMFVILCALISLSILGLGIAVEYQWLVFEPHDGGLVVAFTVTMVFGVVAYAVFLLSEDLLGAAASLRRENERVKNSQQALERLAHHDALTKLPNRVLARDRFELAYAQSKRDQRELAVLYLDLDHFKNINDTQGHLAGDQVLVQIAERLSNTLRKSDTVCRLGGDEFLILIPELSAEESLAQVAQKILDVVDIPVQLPGGEFQLSCSLGIAVAPGDGEDFDSLLTKADQAMYQAKDRGRGVYCFFNAQMDQDLIEYRQLVADLRQGLLKDEFVLWYQPFIHLQSQTYVAGEALIRWQHPGRGLLAPATFIPLAESSGLIGELGDWVLRNACLQCVECHQAGLDKLRVSINVSVQQFRRGGLADRVAECLQQAGLAGKYLSLEVTESLLVEDDEQFMEELNKIRALGVGIALDDFGTGFSNLSFLKKHSFINIKIDKSFVSNILNDDNEATIFHAIVQLASGLGVLTVAEGVEDAATAAAVAASGCTLGQGYYWSKPLPLAEFQDFMQRHAAKPR